MGNLHNEFGCVWSRLSISIQVTSKLVRDTKNAASSGGSLCWGRSAFCDSICLRTQLQSFQNLRRLDSLGLIDSNLNISALCLIEKLFCVILKKISSFKTVEINFYENEMFSLLSFENKCKDQQSEQSFFCEPITTTTMLNKSWDYIFLFHKTWIFPEDRLLKFDGIQETIVFKWQDWRWEELF